MSTDRSTVPVSKSTLWTGRILSFLPALLLLFDAVMKLIKPAFVIEGTKRLGYPENVITPLGIVLLVSVLLYLYPRTAVLGAILLTGYLGGAVASHVRASGTLFEIVFPAIFGAVLWSGLVLRDGRLRGVLPLRK